MKNREYLTLFVTTCFSLVILTGCVNQKETRTEVTQEELTSAVPALDDLHSVIYSLWHEAYPNKDFKLMTELLPQVDSLLAKVNDVKLPGILRDRQTAWDNGKADLNASLQALHKAVEVNNQAEILQQVEAFHRNFEKLVRIIRPVLPELEAFHQELYKLYHYYTPNYELTQIRETVTAMQSKLPPLQQAALPKRLADRQDKFDSAVANLVVAVSQLADTIMKDDRKAIQKAVANTHDVYQTVEGIFD